MGKFLILILLLSTSLAHAGEFAGKWSGPGIWITDSLANKLETQTVLTVEETSDALGFSECWSFQDPNQGQRMICIKNKFQIKDGSLYLKNLKVGDISSGQILIYQGNRQVGEQIRLQLFKTGEVHYRYSYMNMDGASIRREAKLTLK